MKKYLAVLMMAMAVTSTANAKSYGCWGPDPKHDWTFGIKSHQFGVEGYDLFTIVYFGFGSWTMPFSFYPTIACIGIGLGTLIGGGILLARRK